MNSFNIIKNKVFTYGRANYGLTCVIQRQRKLLNEEWEKRISDNLMERKMVILREMNGVKKGSKEQNFLFIKGRNGELLRSEEEVGSRWGKYFYDLINFKDNREGRGGEGEKLTALMSKNW